MLRLAPGLAVAVSGVALTDGAWWHRTPDAVLTRWASTATTVAVAPHRLLTSVFITSGPRMTAGICVGFAGVAFGELRLGWRRALRCGLAGTVLATLACDAVLLLAARAAIPSARVAESTLDFGASALTAGVVGAASMTLTRWWRFALAVVVLNGLVITHGLADFEHLVAFGVGAVLA